jgi:general stress protein 26
VTSMSLDDLSRKMGEIDFAILSTRSESGHIAGRPMSNNGDVEYKGDSYFFTFENAHTVEDIMRDEKVALSFTGNKGLLGKPPIFITVEGTAELIRDKAAFEEHWTKELDFWFKDGINTPDIVLIKVHAVRIHYWNGVEDGEVTMSA